MAGNTTTRELSWLSLLDREELDASRETIEYQFSARGSRGIANMRTHEDGMRVFRGYTNRRGPYAPVTLDPCNLTWRGLAILWQGQPLCWEAGPYLPVGADYLYDDDAIAALSDDDEVSLQDD